MLAPLRGGADGGQAGQWTEVAEEVAPSVVSIVVRTSSGGDQGSGVVIDEDGHVLTNRHVIAPAAGGGQIQVVLADATVLRADVVGSDPETDLAVLELDSPPDDLPPLPFGDSADVEVAEPVMALGNPLGLSETTTLGIISAVDRPVTTQASDAAAGASATPVVTNAIQTDAAVNPGNSGGALVDAAGELIGINSSIASLGASSGGQSGSIGLGFAIPSNQAHWVAEELIDSGSVEHAYLGVTLQDAVVEVDGVQRQAAGVSDVAGGTPADDAGVEVGEAVTAVDGETVASALSLTAQVRERQPGTDVTLTVVDDGGETREVTVEFGVRPD